MLFLFGQRDRNVGIIETDDSCPHCERGSLSFILTRGYVHLFWIPLFPLGRAAYVVCDHCKWFEDTRDLIVEPQSKEDEEHNAALREIAKEATTPWWYWTGTLLVLGFLATVLLFG